MMNPSTTVTSCGPVMTSSGGKMGVPCNTDWQHSLNMNAKMCGFSDPFEECCRQMRCDPSCTNVVNFTINSCPDYLVPQDLMARRENMKIDMKDSTTNIMNVNDMVTAENLAAVFMRCPPVEIVQTQTEWIMYFDVPGCRKEDVRVRIHVSDARARRRI